MLILTTLASIMVGAFAILCHIPILGFLLGLAAMISGGSVCKKSQNRHVIVGVVAGVILGIFGIIGSVERIAEFRAKAISDHFHQAERVKD